MVPSGIRVQPSSALKSLLPADPIAVHVSVVGSNAATCLVVFRPSRNKPLGSTAAGESPMSYHPAGGFTIVHVFFTGSKIALWLVRVNEPPQLLYSPPVRKNRPSARTAPEVA